MRKQQKIAIELNTDESTIERLRHTYQNMKRRCLNSSHPKYHRYGGRGIEVCANWLKSFENFINDMGLKPNSELTLERIDNDGNYTLSNCKWATQKEQQNNRSNNI